MNEVKPEDIESLIDVFDKSDWEELRITSAGFEIYLSKDATQRDRYRSASAAPVAAHGVESQASVPRRTAGGASAQRTTSPAPRQLAIPDGMVEVRAPSLGTFYQAPKPGAQPYVDVGQRVEPDTEICVIEVMKLFTAVRAGVTGIVRRVLVSDAQMVEFDQPLFLIEPAD